MKDVLASNPTHDVLRMRSVGWAAFGPHEAEKRPELIDNDQQCHDGEVPGQRPFLSCSAWEWLSSEVSWAGLSSRKRQFESGRDCQLPVSPLAEGPTGKPGYRASSRTVSRPFSATALPHGSVREYELISSLIFHESTEGASEQRRDARMLHVAARLRPPGPVRPRDPSWMKPATTTVSLPSSSPWSP